MARLGDSEIQERLAALEGWTREGNAIHKTFNFPDFPRAIAFVERMVAPAEGANHHPDIDIRYNRVMISLSTHSEGGITEKDFELANQIDTLGEA